MGTENNAVRDDSMTLRDRVEQSLKYDIAPALLLDGNGIEVLEVSNGDRKSVV